MDRTYGYVGLLGSYTDEELLRWETVGSAPSRFGDLLRATTRASLLSTAIGPSFGEDVERGLARDAVQTALALAATPAPDRRGQEAKRIALRHVRSARGEGVLEAMIRAALEHDERRFVSRRTRIPRRAGPGPLDCAPDLVRQRADLAPVGTPGSAAGRRRSR